MLIICTQSDSDSETETTIVKVVESSSMIPARLQRTYSILIMIDDHDDADDDTPIRSLDRSNAFDNSINSISSMMTIDPIPLAQSHEEHDNLLLMKLNPASSSYSTASTFTLMVSDTTTLTNDDYNENHNYGHNNYEEYNCTDSTIATITDASNRIICFGNTNNTTDPIIRTSFGSTVAIASKSSITDPDRDHRDHGGNVNTHANNVNTNNTSSTNLNTNTNSTNPLFEMYVQLKRERQQKEEKLQLQQARLHQQHQEPIDSNSNNNKYNMNHNHTHVMMNNNDGFNDARMQTTSFTTTNCNGIITNYNNDNNTSASSFGMFNPIRDDNNDDDDDIENPFRDESLLLMVALNDELSLSLSSSLSSFSP